MRSTKIQSKICTHQYNELKATVGTDAGGEAKELPFGILRVNKCIDKKSLGDPFGGQDQCCTNMLFESVMDSLKDAIINHHYFKTKMLLGDNKVYKEELKEFMKPLTFREVVIQALMKKTFHNMTVYTQLK